MKQSIIVFMLFLILVAIYRIYTLKQREGFQTTASCPTNVDTRAELNELVQNKRYNCLENLDVSKVQDMKSIFNGVSSFNQPLNKWNVSGVKSMQEMFYGASSFNQPLNNWGKNVSGVESMHAMFAEASSFNQDISGWDVSGATTMFGMFYGAKAFNQPLNNWGENVRNVKKMNGMFYGAEAFNQDISDWDVRGVTDFTDMFKDSGLAKDTEKTNLKKIYCSWKDKVTDGGKSTFDTEMKKYFYDITQLECCPNKVDKWSELKELVQYKRYNCLENLDVSKVQDLTNIFNGAKDFNQPLNKWNVSGATNMQEMFYEATAFNQPLNNWGKNVSGVKNMQEMFYEATAFNQPLNNWGKNVSGVENMNGMFAYANAFNQPLNKWNVKGVKNMNGMFAYAAFNQDISGWNVSGVKSMQAMFAGAAFNQVISGWDVSGATDMESMFYSAKVFNQPLNNWGKNVKNVANMYGMFAEAKAFNQPLNKWVVSGVKSMHGMFYGAEAFNQVISGWDVSGATDMQEMFTDAISFNQDISGWDVSNVINFTDMFKDSGLANDVNKTNLKKIYCSWKNKITDGGGKSTFETEIKRVLGDTLPNCVSASLTTGKATTTTGKATTTTGKATTTTGKATTATGTTKPATTTGCPTNVDTRAELKELVQYKRYNCLENLDVSKVQNMHGMFAGANDFNQPLNNWGENIKSVANMQAMFAGATSFNQPLNNWGKNISGVKNMQEMFFGASSFNQPLNKWGENVSGVKSMEGMFAYAAFNQPLNKWNVKGVKNMNGMFAYAAFNQPLNNWGKNVSGVKSMQAMFAYSAFNQPLNNWGENVSGVANMQAMFAYTAFNQDISGWDVSGATNMQYMFAGAKTFNQPLNNWGKNVSKVQNMKNMFYEAEAFNQDISDWDVRGVTDFTDMFKYSGLAKDTEKTNLIKIYCSWKNKVTDGGKSTFDTEIKRVLGDTLPNCVSASLTTGKATTTTGKATTTTGKATTTTGKATTTTGKATTTTGKATTTTGKATTTTGKGTFIPKPELPVPPTGTQPNYPIEPNNTVPPPSQSKTLGANYYNDKQYSPWENIGEALNWGSSLDRSNLFRPRPTTPKIQPHTHRKEHAPHHTHPPSTGGKSIVKNINIKINTELSCDVLNRSVDTIKTNIVELLNPFSEFNIDSPSIVVDCEERLITITLSKPVNTTLLQTLNGLLKSNPININENMKDNTKTRIKLSIHEKEPGFSLFEREPHKYPKAQNDCRSSSPGLDALDKPCDNLFYKT